MSKCLLIERNQVLTIMTEALGASEPGAWRKNKLILRSDEGSDQ